MKFYTAFIFDTPYADLHCTHKYLGELTDEQLEEILELLEDFFVSKPRELPRVRFDQRDWFGHRRNIAVLTPSESEGDFFLELREQLHRFRPEDYAEFRPHVSTALECIDIPFRGFALMSKDAKIWEWRRRDPAT